MSLTLTDSQIFEKSGHSKIKKFYINFSFKNIRDKNIVSLTVAWRYDVPMNGITKNGNQNNGNQLKDIYKKNI